MGKHLFRGAPPRDLRALGAEAGSGYSLGLPVNDDLREEEAGRALFLLHDGSAVSGSQRVRWSDGRVSEGCAGLVSLSPYALGYRNTKPSFDVAPRKTHTFTVDEEGSHTLPAAKGDVEVMYRLEPAAPPSL